MTHPIVDDELTQLAHVRALLEEVPFDLPPSEADVVHELVRLREEMQGAKDEDKAAIMQQYDHQFALLQQLRDARDREHVDPDSPYFAHLRLREEGRSRSLFLGKATRIDHGLRIVDWRNAPISRVFYSYQQDEEYEEQFGGRTVVGTVEARRTVTVMRGALERIDAPEGVFRRSPTGTWDESPREVPRLAGGQGSSVTRTHAAGEGMERRLGTDGRGRATRIDKRLPDIAGLIDPEQFDLITRPSTGFLVIRGTAGSGKTTVALHRIAYLAYEDPGVDSPATLFVVFSKALRDYVANVLPNLGVQRVRPVTFPEWATSQRRAHFPNMPKVYRDDTPEVVIRLKTHPATMIALEQQRDLVSGQADAEQALDDWASVLTSYELLSSVLGTLAPHAFTSAELDKATTWCRDRHNELVDWRDGDREAPAMLDREDDALLLRAWQLRVGPLRFRGQRPLQHRHIAIDEVQDFSPVEIRVLLGTLDARKSITLAGDTQQHVMANAGFTNWTEFFGWLGVEGTAVETLRVAYRSSRQIVTFAMGVLGPLLEDDTPPLTVREGPEVELFPFTDHGACVAFLADALNALARSEPFANVALVVPDTATALMYVDGLKASEVPRVRRVVDEEFAFAPGVEVVEVRDVKGLEFDYVVLVEASAHHYPDTAASRRLLHVAATRAIHQLWVTSVGTPSPILRDAVQSES